LVGTFYRAGKPGVPPLVTEGSQVEDDTVVGIIEALHELTDVEAGCRGIVSKVFATDGQPVEYGQPLFEVSQLGE
jgi:acetyl-CoA carboxylase biotin carboxyl carrier protein